MTEERQPQPAPTDRAMEIVLEVADLERSLRFYREGLGMPEITRFSAERPAVWVKAAPGTYLGLWTARAGGPGVGVHGSSGGAHVHLAFLVPAGGLEGLAERWRGLFGHGLFIFGGTLEQKLLGVKYAILAEMSCHDCLGFIAQ